MTVMTPRPVTPAAMRMIPAIVSPSHSFSINTGHPVRQQLEGVLSPMGDFNRVMTVRQRIDRYAFIRGTSECDPILWR